jgi:hypothetical protein
VIGSEDSPSKAHKDAGADRTRSVVRFGWNLYQQVAAALAAFSLAAFVGSLLHVGWRGFLTDLIRYWDQYVRPVVKWLTHALVSVPLGWLGWRVEVPESVRDYISVGIILTLSLLRVARREEEGMMGFVLGPLRRDWGEGPIDALFTVALWPVLVPFVWPATILVVVPVVVWGAIKADAEERRWLLGGYGAIFAPLIYLAVLVAINYWVM